MEFPFGENEFLEELERFPDVRVQTDQAIKKKSLEFMNNIIRNSQYVHRSASGDAGYKVQDISRNEVNEDRRNLEEHQTR